jgi:Protein kinase domain
VLSPAAKYSPRTIVQAGKKSYIFFATMLLFSCLHLFALCWAVHDEANNHALTYSHARSKGTRIKRRGREKMDDGPSYIELAMADRTAGSAHAPAQEGKLSSGDQKPAVSTFSKGNGPNLSTGGGSSGIDMSGPQSQSTSPLVYLEDVYEIGQFVGSGGNGDVFRIMSRSTDDMLACKIVASPIHAKHEFFATKRAAGPGVIQVHRYFRVRTEYKNYFEPWSITMELLDSNWVNLKQFIIQHARNNFYNEQLVMVVFMQVVNTVRFIHSRGISHNDIKRI